MSQVHNKPPGRWTLTLPNDVQHVPQLSMFVEDICTAINLDEMTMLQMNLAIEEAVVNVMNYAYPEGVNGHVDIEVTATDEWLTFVITDTGKPFDPTKSAEVDITLSAEERRIGGLGIHLVRRLMDDIQYEYVDGHNILTLRKKRE